MLCTVVYDVSFAHVEFVYKPHCVAVLTESRLEGCGATEATV